MEYVIVTFPTNCPVYIDGTQCGSTNALLRIDAGTHIFDLGLSDCEPVSHTTLVQDTSALDPLVVCFCQKND